MPILLALLLGAAAGHALRRATPALLGLRDRRMPYRWPWLEALGATAAVAITATRGELGHFALATALLAVTATDVYRKLIPDRITFTGTLFGLAAATVEPARMVERLSQHETLVLLGLPPTPTAGHGLLLGLLGAALGFGLLEGFRRLVAVVADIEGMGMGDAKLLMMIGAFLGPHAAVLTILPACAVGAAVGIVHRLRTGMPHAPFGPALAAGGLVIALWGEGVLAAVWRTSLALISLPPAWVAVIYGGLVLLLVLLMVRLRRRAEVYRELVERDYRAIEAELDGAEEAPTAAGDHEPL